jgi:hypothetical protein
VSTNFERSPDAPEASALPVPDDLSSDLSSPPATERAAPQLPAEPASTLAQLAPGSRLVLRCRKDWRAAAVSAVTPDCVVLTVASPSGHSYRVRRPHDSPLAFDGSIPVLSDRGSSGWRVALARYDARW